MTERQESSGDFHKTILNAIPVPLFVVDGDMRILEFNETAAAWLEPDPGLSIRKRGGEALQCIRALDSPEGCGRGELCKTCVIRNSVKESIYGRKIVRRPTHMELMRGDQFIRKTYHLVTTAPFVYDQASYVLLVLEDISELIEIKSLLPMCASCKRIRDDREYWNTVEAYFKKTLDVDFTHGICPDCIAKLYPELFK